MHPPVLLLAQCAGAVENCDLPRTLPWYFGAVIALVWLATVAGILLLLRRRISAVLDARRDRRGRARGRQLQEPKRADVELW